MKYETLAEKNSVQKTVDKLRERNVEAILVETGEEALAKIKELIPEGASVMNGASRTLEQIGYIDYLKSGQHGWNNLHAAILAEKDPVKQALLRKQSVTSDFYLGSVHGIAETGEIVVASNSGSQLPHIVFTSSNVILVISTKKIVTNLADAMNRLYEHVIPLEDKRMMEAYGVGTAPNKILILNGENPKSTRKIRVILINQDLGF